MTFPSGARLRVVSGPTGREQEHWDPNGTGNPLLDTTDGDVRLSANFTVAELARTGGVRSDTARIAPELVTCLQAIRDHLGRSVRVTSGYRSWWRNRAVYQGRDREPTRSRHCSGQGADIKVTGLTGMDIAKAAIDACGVDIGVGIGGSYVHVDVRRSWAAWSYLGGERGKRARDEIRAYARARRTGRTGAPAPSTAPSGRGPTLKKVQRRYTGYAGYAGPRLRDSIAQLAARGQVSVSDLDIDTLQRVAEVEVRGLTSGVNTWDTAVVSAGFKQWTLLTGTLQDLISRAPAVFARHGIRIDPARTYPMRWGPQPAIVGVAQARELRSEDWARRFLLATLEEEAVVAAIRKCVEDVHRVSAKARSIARGKELSWRPELDAPRNRALLIQLANNRPAYLMRVLPRVLRRAGGTGGTAFRTLLVEEIVREYAQREKKDGRAKALRWTEKVTRP